MMKFSSDPEELIVVLRDELTFEQFLKLKSEWLTNIRMEWLVMGHVDAEKALHIVETSEKSFKFNQLPED